MGQALQFPMQRSDSSHNAQDTVPPTIRGTLLQSLCTIEDGPSLKGVPCATPRPGFACRTSVPKRCQLLKLRPPSVKGGISARCRIGSSFMEMSLEHPNMSMVVNDLGRHQCSALCNPRQARFRQRTARRCFQAAHACCNTPPGGSHALKRCDISGAFTSSMTSWKRNLPWRGCMQAARPTGEMFWYSLVRSRVPC